MQHRRRVAAQTALAPAADFEALIGQPNARVPMSARHKMAVVHADGAGFGAALLELQKKGADAGLKLFSDRAQALQKAIVDSAVAWAAGWSSGGVLQFEVLMAGGDDLLFVLPAWRLFDLLGRFHDWTARETIEGNSVHFRLGAIVADRRTPIRQTTALAFEAVDTLRASQLAGSLFCVDVFESAAPPMDGLSAHRKRLYGSAYSDSLQAWQLAQADTLAHNLRALRAGGDNILPRSQIYRALRGLPDLSSAGETVSKNLEHYGERTGGAKTLTLGGVHTKNPALHLAWAAQLWDYCGGEE
jgi:hypothetical protein